MFALCFLMLSQSLPLERAVCIGIVSRSVEEPTAFYWTLVLALTAWTYTSLHEPTALQYASLPEPGTWQVSTRDHCCIHGSV